MDALLKPKDQVLHVWRGPTILTLSLLTLLVPQMLTYCSVPTLALLLSIGIAFYISIRDLMSFVQWKYNNIKYDILSQCNDIVLDEWLQNTVGYLSASYGLAMVTILLYSLPLPRTVRLQFIQYLSSYIPSLEDEQYTIEEIMYEPGGLSRLMSMFCFKDTPAAVDASVTANAPMDSIPILPTVHELNDLYYPEEGEEEEDKEIYAQGTNQKEPHHPHDPPPISSSASSTAESTTTPTLYESYIPKHLHYHHDQEHKSLSFTHNIYMDILKYTLEQLLSKINPEKIQRIGISAGLALLVQMKYSSVARQTFKNVLQGSIVIGLSSIMLGSCASLYTKKRLWKWMVRPHKEKDEPTKEKTQESNRIFLYGHGIWMSLVYKFQHDQSFRRKWKAFLCMTVLYLIRKQSIWNSKRHK